MPKQIVYSPKYNVDIGTHVFPTNKYDLIKERLINNHNFIKEDFIESVPAKGEDILLVHTPEYFKKIKCGTLTVNDEMKLELPYSPQLAQGSFICVGGSIKAAQIALEQGMGVHLGGGFHHAFADHGEGFCVFNDHAVAIAYLLKNNKIKKAAVIDCDLHQGNGTASIFKNNTSVFTFSIHQENNYPIPKEKSDLDIGLDNNAEDAAYLDALKQAVKEIILKEKPDFIVYVAGADTYRYDQLGGLALTIGGMKQRDEIVLGFAGRYKIPALTVLAGGYAVEIKDTITIHANAVLTAVEYTRG